MESYQFFFCFLDTHLKLSYDAFASFGRMRAITFFFSLFLFGCVSFGRIESAVCVVVARLLCHHIQLLFWVIYVWDFFSYFALHTILHRLPLLLRSIHHSIQTVNEWTTKQQQQQQLEKRRNEKKNVCEQCAPCENDELTLDELYYCRCDEHMYKLAHKIVVGVRIVVNRIGWRFECGACSNPIVTNSVSSHIALAPCTHYTAWA